MQIIGELENLIETFHQQEKQITDLKNQVRLLTKERNSIIKCVENNNLKSLREYFGFEGPLKKYMNEG